MIVLRKYLIALACMIGLIGSATAQSEAPEARVMRLTSLEWPPYTGVSLREQGATTAVVRAALAAMGYRLDVAFYPWSRAVTLVERDSGFVGYFPEYMSPDVARDFLLSNPIGSGPLGFAERVDQPLAWERLEDLAQHRIGVVQDYVNTEAFDSLVREKKLTVDTAVNDTHNLLKLAAGRVSLAVVDQRVFEYLMRRDAKVKAVAARLRFNDRLLEDKKLYICFRRGPEGERARAILNEGLKKIDVASVMADALE